MYFESRTNDFSLVAGDFHGLWGRQNFGMHRRGCRTLRSVFVPSRRLWRLLHHLRRSSVRLRDPTGTTSPLQCQIYTLRDPKDFSKCKNEIKFAWDRYQCKVNTCFNLYQVGNFYKLHDVDLKNLPNVSLLLLNPLLLMCKQIWPSTAPFSLWTNPFDSMK